MSMTLMCLFFRFGFKTGGQNGENKKKLVLMVTPTVHTDPPDRSVLDLAQGVPCHLAWEDHSPHLGIWQRQWESHLKDQEVH